MHDTNDYKLNVKERRRRRRTGVLNIYLVICPNPLMETIIRK